MSANISASCEGIWNKVPKQSICMITHVTTVVIHVKLKLICYPFCLAVEVWPHFDNRFWKRCAVKERNTPCGVCNKIISDAKASCIRNICTKIIKKNVRQVTIDNVSDFWGLLFILTHILLVCFLHVAWNGNLNGRLMASCVQKMCTKNYKKYGNLSLSYIF